MEDIEKLIQTLTHIAKQSWKADESKGVAITQEGLEFYQSIFTQWGTTGNLDIYILLI